jgi:hypothetical protein
MHSVGANISILYAEIDKPGTRYTFTMAVTHFAYYPRYTLTESDNYSVSVGSPLGAGVGLLTSSGSATGITWGFDLPVVIDYNTGYQSTPGNENNTGAYFGGGLGFMYTGWTGDSDGGKATSFGPLVRAGIRFGRWNFAAGIFGKYGLEKEHYKTFGFNILKEL